MQLGVAPSGSQKGQGMMIETGKRTGAPNARMYAGAPTDRPDAPAIQHLALHMKLEWNVVGSCLVVPLVV